MPEWLKVTLALLVFGGIFWAAVRRLRTSQQGDPSKRGQDSDDWGGPYDHTGSD